MVPKPIPSLVSVEYLDLFLCSLPLFLYLQNRPNNFLFTKLQSIISLRFGIYIFALPFLIEALVIDPQDYPSYATTLHGWVLGLICFTCGFIFVSLKDYFWNALEKIKSFSLIVAFFFIYVSIINDGIMGT